MDRIWHNVKSNGRLIINLELFELGEDFLILLTGGKSHIGCIGLYNGEEKRFLCLPGHKEQEALELLREVIGENFSRPVAVIGGIHFTHITAEEIAGVLRLVRELAADLGAYLKANKITAVQRGKN